MANLSYGSSGDEVKTLQQNLNSVGNYGLDVDGAYGPKTQAAVRDYQSKNGLDVDGVYGPQTSGHLLAALNPGTPTTPVGAQTQTAAVPAVSGPTPAQTMAAGSAVSQVPASTLSQTISGIRIPGVDAPDAPDLRPELERWLAAANEQAQGQIDYATQTGVTQLQRAYEDALPQYQQMRNQISASEAKALDNAALYAEARGDRGGIGQAQYNAIMNTAMQNHLQVNQQQTKMATDTARGIADLRAQGEFEKADKLLELTQTYLSELMSLEQWAAQYNLSVAQFRRSIEEWNADFQMKAAQVLEDQRQWEYGVAQDQDKVLANAGEALLSAGIMPSESQLAAMGMTADQAQQYITAIQLSMASSGGGGGGGGGGGSDYDDYDDYEDELSPDLNNPPTTYYTYTTNTPTGPTKVTTPDARQLMEEYRRQQEEEAKRRKAGGGKTSGSGKQPNPRAQHANTNSNKKKSPIIGSGGGSGFNLPSTPSGNQKY